MGGNMQPIGDRIFDLIREAMKELEVKQIVITKGGINWTDDAFYNAGTKSFGLGRRIGEKVTRSMFKFGFKELVRIKVDQHIGTVTEIRITDEGCMYAVRSEGKVAYWFKEEELEKVGGKEE